MGNDDVRMMGRINASRLRDAVASAFEAKKSRRVAQHLVAFPQIHRWRSRFLGIETG